ncbi:MAG: efflux RND transporter periplasmic adaptor subunit [Candidatus Marinimicrobia bacterium]|nr:efflux RND transporter periplasmic adaptor subunit [Candidatus Neomarinimicrobiota bacterium]
MIEKKNKNLKKYGIIAGSIAVVFILIYFIFFHDFQSKLIVQKDRITIATVTEDDFIEYIPPIGTVIPIKTIYLDAIQGGQVENKFLKAGAMVQEGDPIISLSNIDLLLDIMHREAEVYQQTNNLRNTRLQMEQNQLDLQMQLTQLKFNIKTQERKYHRYLQLFEKKLVSEEEYQEVAEHFEYLKEVEKLTILQNQKDSTFREIQVEQLENSLDRMDNNLKIARENLDKLTIKAPITGQLTSLNAEIGQSIHRGERIGQVDVLDGFKIRAGVDEHYIARINLGQKGSFDFDGKTYDLEITKIYPEVLQGKFNIDLQFVGESPSKIRRGQTIHMKLELGDAEKAVVIPTGGFFQKTGGQWIFVVDETTRTAVKRKIKIGRQNPKYYRITEGLEPGEKVIISSYDNFGDIEKLVLK